MQNKKNKIFLRLNCQGGKKNVYISEGTNKKEHIIGGYFGEKIQGNVTLKERRISSISREMYLSSIAFAMIQKILTNFEELVYH